MDLDKYFKKSELIPAIVQEQSTGEVLMLAYMNKESLQKTLETGYTWFWSVPFSQTQGFAAGPGAPPWIGCGPWR